MVAEGRLTVGGQCPALDCLDVSFGALKWDVHPVAQDESPFTAILRALDSDERELWRIAHTYRIRRKSRPQDSAGTFVPGG